MIPKLPDGGATAKPGAELPCYRMSHSALIRPNPTLTPATSSDPINPWILALKLLGAGLLMVAVLYVLLFKVLTDYVLYITTRNQP